MLRDERMAAFGGQAKKTAISPLARSNGEKYQWGKIKIFVASRGFHQAECTNIKAKVPSHGADTKIWVIQ
ncbi:hypothetical protein [Pseudophaeobacter sp. EL27]|uniref:hypothetical protein n=1 Tax=Pseudophaeobacter sp. EL27 TaxID=2107580 RepID=UPI000EFA8192|nr:hypothetical protein [Pseudophaeobacter sp. EL27]